MNYFNLGVELFNRLTEDGTKAIDKEVVSTLTTEEIEALIIAIRAVENKQTYETLSNLLDEHDRREPFIKDGFQLPNCFHYFEVNGLELCNYGGSYSVINIEDCVNCPNYCVMVGL